MDALHKLQDAQKRFAQSFYQADPKRSQQLASGQSPSVMLITCADSRICPDLIFDTEPGEMFVVRNVASFVHSFAESASDFSVRAALEYGVLHLAVQHIIVMGHSQCGGIKALMSQQTGQAIGEFIDPWLKAYSKVADHVQQTHTNESEQEQCKLCELSAIKQSLLHLDTYPWIQSRRAAGELHLHGWHFDIGTGAIRAYNSEQDTFE